MHTGALSDEVAFFDPRHVLPEPPAKIAGLHPNQKDVTLCAMALDKQLMKGPNGPVWYVQVGDPTGCVTLTCKVCICLAGAPHAMHGWRASP